MRYLGITVDKYRLTALLVAIAGCLLGVYGALHLKSSADADHRLNQMRELYNAVKRFDEWHGHLPQNHCDHNGNALTSWRLDLLPMTIGVKHAFNVNESWQANVNSRYRMLAHPLYCTNSTDTQVFSVAAEMQRCPTDTRESLKDLHPEGSILIDIPVHLRIHWMEPKDPSLSELSANSSARVTSALILFADGQIWELPSDQLTKVQPLIAVSRDDAVGVRAEFLMPIATRLYPEGDGVAQ